MYLVFEKNCFFFKRCFLFLKKKTVFFSNDVFYSWKKNWFFFFQTMFFILEKKCFFFKRCFLFLEKNFFFFNGRCFFSFKKTLRVLNRFLALRTSYSFVLCTVYTPFYSLHLGFCCSFPSHIQSPSSGGGGQREAGRGVAVHCAWAP